MNKFLDKISHKDLDVSMLGWGLYQAEVGLLLHKDFYLKILSQNLFNARKHSGETGRILQLIL